MEENNRINNQIVQSVIPKEITKISDNQNLDQPTIKAWQKQNPHRSINDYYQIYGVPQSPIITPTYTYEEAYYIHEKPSNSWLYITVATVLVIVIAVITNPNEDKHKSAVKSKLIGSKISNALTDKTNNTGNSDKDAARRIGVVLGSVIGGSIVEEMVDNLVTTDNYIVFSTTKVNVKGENKITGFGAFGNVFLSDKLNLDLLYGLENDNEKEKSLGRNQQDLQKNENKFIDNYEQNTTEIVGKHFTVVSGKAHFYKSPDLQSNSRFYLIHGERSKVYSSNGDFIYTKFTNALGETTKGWIRISDINIH